MEAPTYIELKPREEVIAVVQATLVPGLWKFALYTLLSVLPFFFLFPLWKQGAWGVGVFFLWLVIGLVLLWRQYFMWARTVFLVTNQRVIDHDQRGFFHRVLTQARFDQIDEVSVRVKGIVPTLAHYGTLTLEVEGSAANLQISRVKRPDHLANLINDLRGQTRLDTHANP